MPCRGGPMPRRAGRASSQPKCGREVLCGTLPWARQAVFWIVAYRESRRCGVMVVGWAVSSMLFWLLEISRPGMLAGRTPYYCLLRVPDPMHFSFFVTRCPFLFRAPCRSRPLCSFLPSTPNFDLTPPSSFHPHTAKYPPPFPQLPILTLFDFLASFPYPGSLGAASRSPTDALA